MRAASLRVVFLGAVALTWTCSGSVSQAGYVETNLVSDIQGLANNYDPNLQNPWGVSFSGTLAVLGLRQQQ